MRKLILLLLVCLDCLNIQSQSCWSANAGLNHTVKYSIVAPLRGSGIEFGLFYTIELSKYFALVPGIEAQFWGKMDYPTVDDTKNVTWLATNVSIPLSLRISLSRLHIQNGASIYWNDPRLITSNRFVDLKQVTPYFEDNSRGMLLGYILTVSYDLDDKLRPYVAFHTPMVKLRTFENYGIVSLGLCYKLGSH